ncbi:FecR domain-containing protein [Gammaproteobacteria bacterium]|nr:FecR domain-containing protein [Gammaproteobacteria bacterium]
MNTKAFTNGLLIAYVLLVLPFGATAANDEVEVGVTAASVTDAIGKPPVSPARDLETGLEVFFNEQISTDDLGRVQLLFRDGTSLTIGASSEITIDKYLYDPTTGTGDMVVSISKGVFRLIGGKISKNKPIVFNSPSATVSVRGGVLHLKQSSAGTEATLLFGTGLEVTSLTSGLTTSTSQPGRVLSLKTGQTTAPTSQPANSETLAQQSASLEKSLEQPASASAEKKPSESNQNAASAQPEESTLETAAADGSQADTAPQPESAEKQIKETDGQGSALAGPEPGPNQLPMEESGLITGQENPEGPLPENNQPSPETRSEPELVPMTPTESMADGSTALPPLPSSPDDLQTDLVVSPEGLSPSSEFGATLMPEVGTATNITATDPMPELAPLTSDSEQAIYVAPEIAALPTEGIPSTTIAPAGIKLEINSLAVDFGKRIVANAPRVGSPIGGNPTQAQSNPTSAVIDVVKVVDDTIKTTGVRTDDGRSATTPTGGWEPAGDIYTFTGSTDEEKPTYFAVITPDSKMEFTDRCDPAVDGYCPPESEVTDTRVSESDTAPSPTEVVEVETTTTSCDSTAGCEVVTEDAITTSTSSPSESESYSPSESESYSPSESESYSPSESESYSPSESESYSPSESESYSPSESESYSPSESESSSPSESRSLSRSLAKNGTGEITLISSVGQKGVSIRLIGEQIPLCNECRFLKWHRKTTSITGITNSVSEIQHWISGVITTASELSAAADKTASYSGGLIGAVSQNGFISETTGSFDAQVRFGIDAYQVENFNADFNGRRYSGNSVLTSNDKLFSLTGHSDAKTMSASGYFFGSPAHGNPPPNLGGHFEVTGPNYYASGIFGGSQR